MARIPLTVANRTLDTGNVVSYPSGGQVGNALSGFGDALQGAAARIKQKDDQKAAFQTDILESEFNADLNTIEDQTIRAAPADGSGIHDTVYGELDPTTGLPVKPGEFDAKFDEYLARVPDSQKSEFAAKRELYRKQGSNRMAGQQYKAEQAYYGVEIQKQQGQLVNSIGLMGDPNDAATFDAYKKQGLDLIEKSGLPALEKDVAKANWEAQSEEALVKAYIAKDPSQVRGMLGLPEPVAAGQGGGAIGLLRKFEGFREGTYWDVNAHRTGYGSDTITRADGSVKRVQQGDTVTRADAERDLARRAADFAHKAATQVGAEKWAQLPANARAALTSVAYNYGSLPSSVVIAAASGSVEQIASAVEGLKGHNGGVNAKRRTEEAAIIRGTAGIPSSAGAPDPRVANIPLDRRIVLANAADTAVNEIRAVSRGAIEIAVANAPIAIQNTGEYSGQMPTPEDFNQAYGPQEGSERFAKFATAVETSKQANAMQTMAADDIRSVVAGAAPTSSGETAALDQARFEVLSGAAAQIMAAREKDPAAYVQRVYPSIAQAWKQAAQPGNNSQAAMALTAAAQQHLGIENMRLLPSEVSTRAVDTFKNENLSEQERFGSAASLYFSTADPEQRQAVFEQLVDAGLPDTTAGVFRAAERGDQGAANRLMQAAMIDPSKLPGKAPETPANIDLSIQTDIMDEGQVGDIFYGLSDGSVQNSLSAQRDAKLMNNSVNLRLRNGETLEAAVQAVSKDLFGDVVPVEGNNARILIPSDEDPVEAIRGLERTMPQVQAALEAKMTMPGFVSAGGGQEAIAMADRMNYVNQVLSQGYFTNAGDGFVFMNPKTGLAISDAAGKPIVFKPTAGAGSPVYEQRTPEPGSGPSLDEQGNPVVLGQ